MAYIPRNDEDDESGMNVLAPQQAGQQGASGSSQTGSGGQSSTIGTSGGQPQQGPVTAPKAKKAKSGMFTNLKKYIDKNKAGAQRMSSSLQRDSSKENANIQQAISKQKTDFMSRVDANRNRMTEAQQFGQQTLQSAEQQESQPYLQQQSQDIQERVDQFGNIDNQYVTGYQNQSQQQAPQTFDQYADQQIGVTTQQGVYDQRVIDQQNARQQFEDSVSGYGQFLQDKVQLGETVTDKRRGYGNYQTTTPTIEKSMLQQGVLNQDAEMLNNLKSNIDFKQREVNSRIEGIKDPNFESYDDETKEQMIPGYLQARDQMDSYQNLISQMGLSTEAQRVGTEELGKLEGLQDTYSRAQEQQRLFVNKSNLEEELTVIQSKIDNAPDQLTEDDITRFNNLRIGIERFDDAILNLSSEKRQASDMLERAENLQTNQGRRDLLRSSFGKLGGYTSGQASLDNLILTGDKEATRSLISNIQQQANQTNNELQEAFRSGNITRDELVRGTQTLQKELQSGVESAQNELTSSLEGRVQTGEGTYIKELSDKLESGQGLSQEDMNILGLTGEERYNLDPATLLSQYDPTQYNIQDVANLTDVARAESLARLSGQDSQTTLLNADQIAQRSLRQEGDTQTRTLAELSDVDRASINKFKEDLRGGQKYDNVDQARDAITADLKSQGDAGILADSIQSLVETGTASTNRGPVDLQAILSGDEQALAALQDSAYWAHVGQSGRHGVSIPGPIILSMIQKTVASTEALRTAYSGSELNALRDESESAYIPADIAQQKLGT